MNLKNPTLPASTTAMTVVFLPARRATKGFLGGIVGFAHQVVGLSQLNFGGGRGLGGNFAGGISLGGATSNRAVSSARVGIGVVRALITTICQGAAGGADFLKGVAEGGLYRLKSGVYGLDGGGGGSGRDRGVNGDAMRRRMDRNRDAYDGKRGAKIDANICLTRSSNVGDAGLGAGAASGATG